jgi:peptidoglycan/LPS O-acetylase OafA/YrhL
VAALDGLRGIAITLVVLVHAFGWPANGAQGVDLFLVLSGFLITTLLMREREENGRVDLVAFYKRRARRLMPALLVLLVVYFAVTGAGFETAAGLTYTTDLTRAFDLGPSGALGHLWSLGLEEQFYLVWPAVLFLVVRGRRRVAVALLCLLIAAIFVRQVELVNTGIRVVTGPDTRSLGLAVGCLAALVPFKARRWIPPVALLVVTYVAVTPLQLWGTWSLLFCTACAALILSALNNESLLTRALSWRPLAALGLVSYSVYLWHYPILAAMGVDHRSFGVRTLGLACAIIASVLSWRYVEQPFLRGVRSPRRATSLAESTTH